MLTTHVIYDNIFIMIRNRLTCAVLATGLLASSCADEGRFEDRPGDIYAGETAIALTQNR
jgi:hypothetical protein